MVYIFVTNYRHITNLHKQFIHSFIFDFKVIVTLISCIDFVYLGDCLPLNELRILTYLCRL